jgi:UDP-4-amino-4-deoxy-L-arabinose-oxoglutarate aminotransferase
MSRVEFYRHQLGADEAAAWRGVLDTLFLTLGPQVASFESELGAFLVRDRADRTPPHVVGTSSCSIGMLLALKALDVGPGDEVITTPMTFASTANAILHAGGTPVLADVERSTGLLDPSAVAAAITARTKGILPVHLYGQLADMKALRVLADRHQLFLLEDSAHGIEMERDGVRPGELGDAVVFSFYATKNLTSGDGGAIATRDAKLAERLRRLRNHGATKAAADRHGGVYQHYDFVEVGYKGNLTDLDASLLRIQLPKALEKRARREQIARRYEGLLRERVPGIGLVATRGTSSHHLFTIEAPRGERDRILTRLGAEQIGTAVNYRALHLLTYLKERLKHAPEAFPNALDIGERTISLPMYPTLTDAEQDRVVEAVAASWT